MDGVTPFVKIFTDFGVAALFVAMYLVTVYYYRKEVNEQREKAIAMTERVAIALDKAANAVDSSTEAIQEVTSNMEKTRNDIGKFIEFLRGRDEGRRRQP